MLPAQMVAGFAVIPVGTEGLGFTVMVKLWQEEETQPLAVFLVRA